VRPLVPAVVAAGAGLGYVLVVSGHLTLDLGVGRSVAPLGPMRVDIGARRESVFELLAAPYAERRPRAMAEKVDVIERGSDTVIAAHRTAVGMGMVATTVEAVRFEFPDAIHFRLLRGPVPHVVERFTLHDHEGGTRLEYHGELGTDLWAAGRWWGRLVRRPWEATVRSSIDGVRAEAERRARSEMPSRG